MGLQKAVGDWSRKHFEPNANDKLLGVVEEVGELAHAFLKAKQGIRGDRTTHLAKAKDAVGDILVYLMDLCECEGWSMQEIAEVTVDHVTQRDWTKNPSNADKVAEARAEYEAEERERLGSQVSQAL